MAEKKDKPEPEVETTSSTLTGKLDVRGVLALPDDQLELLLAAFGSLRIEHVLERDQFGELLARFDRYLELLAKMPEATSAGVASILSTPRRAPPIPARNAVADAARAAAGDDAGDDVDDDVDDEDLDEGEQRAPTERELRGLSKAERRAMLPIKRASTLIARKPVAVRAAVPQRPNRRRGR